MLRTKMFFDLHQIIYHNFLHTSVNFKKLLICLMFLIIHFRILLIFRQDAGDDIISQKSLDAVRELIHFLKKSKNLLYALYKIFILYI